MATELRVLMVEDNEDDMFLTLRQLERSGYAPTCLRVEDAAAMRAALAERAWDIVISDWSLPQFSGPEALQVLKESGIDIPFIIVSGTVGEDAAISAMLGGARDFIVKGKLGRLAAAVERELNEHEQRIARRKAEDLLARTEKTRAIGQMAAGVTHDLVNILNPLSLHLQVLSRAIDRGRTDEAKESIAEMKQVLECGMQTLVRLRNYSRQTAEARAELVDLDRLVRQAAEIAKPRMAARGRLLRIREELGGPPGFWGHSGDIVSALVNLIVNAIDALAEGGGSITLRTGQTGGQAWVQVADDGPGMPTDVEKRVFEPFFTTKGDEGTGLGLAMVHACMERHGGSVKLETAPGKGTTFTLSFPMPVDA
ncbi:MAG: response regulator [Polyangiaceae bacterium]|nr:response regulator [Polyangiaceae bacterium]